MASSHLNRQPQEIVCGYRSPTLDCSFTCTRYRTMDIHIELAHSCGACGTYVDDVEAHRSHCVQRGMGRPASRQITNNLDIRPFKEVAHALRGTLLVFSAPVQPPTECQIENVFQTLEYPIRRLTEALVAHFSGVKVSFRLVLDMMETTHDVIHLRDVIGSPFMSVAHAQFIPRIVASSCSFIINSINLYLENGSSWEILKLRELQLHVGQWAPVRGRSYVILPPELKRRRGLLSIRTDSHCFQLSILCGLFEEEILEAGKTKRREKGRKDIQKSKVERAILEHPASYENFLGRMDFSFLPSPAVSLLDVDLVQEKFKDLSITVYGNNGPNILLLRAPAQERDHHVNLLLIKHPEKEDYHYVLIRDISALLGKINEPRRQYCPVCQHPFDARHWGAENHNCGETTIRAPLKQFVKFKRFDALLYAPYIFVYKFFFVPITTMRNDIGESSTCLEERVPVAFSIMVVREDGVVIERDYYTGKDCVDVFFNKLMEKGRAYVDQVKFTDNFLQPTDDQIRQHEDATHCEICGTEFDGSTSIKAYHHSHQTGEKMQTCCVNCNILIKPTNYITAITLGEKNELKFLYGHIKASHGEAVSIRRKEGNFVGIILRKTIQKQNYKFHFGVKMVDMQNFRQDLSLYDLVSEMQNCNEAFPSFASVVGQSALPSSYLLEDENLFAPFPNVQDFLNKYSMPAGQFTRDEPTTSLASLSMEDFVRHKTNAETALISDAFGTIRQKCWKEFSLDVASFFSIASFSRDAALLWEKCELEVLSDREASELVDRAIVGPIVQTTKLKAIANSPAYSNFDPLLPEKHILYVDISGAYTKILMGNLPHRGFRKMTQQELDSFTFETVDLDNFGYLLEVDLDYQSEDVRDFLAEFPFPQEKRVISASSLSPDQRERIAENNSNLVEVERVLQTLYPKHKQVYYGKYLKFMLERGCVVTKIYSGLCFEESPIFGSFATNNALARSESTNEIERRLRKMLNNALYGQMLKRSSDYPKYKRIKTSVEAREELAKHTFQDFEILNEEEAIIGSKKSIVTDVNLRMIGVAVLSNAKILLLSHFWNGLKMHWGDKLKHVCSHTDSCVAEIECSRQEFVDGLRALSHRFDFSNLPDGHELKNNCRAGIPGLLKIQADGIKEFYSTGSTQNSMLIDPNYEQKRILKAGGIAKKQAKELRHEHFKNVVESGIAAEKIRVSSVKVMNNQMLKIENSRSSLVGINVSRYFLSATESLPFGHRSLSKYEYE